MSHDNIAKSQRIHFEAVSELEVAQEKESSIDVRLKDASARMRAISQLRIDGKATENETAEFAALHGDTALLTTMLETAQAETKLATQKVHEAFVWSTDAARAHDREQAAVEFQALKTKTQEIEAVFCKAIGMTARAGKRLGHHSLSQSFQASQALHRAINLGVAPPVGD